MKKSVLLLFLALFHLSLFAQTDERDLLHEELRDSVANGLQEIVTDSLNVVKYELNETLGDSLVVTENYMVPDSLAINFDLGVQGEVTDLRQLEESAEIIRDTTIITLREYDYPKDIDQRWLDELTNSDLFPRMQESILDVSYEKDSLYVREIPELPIDTLKKRLALINESTPFEVTYNPSLESMIKFYVKRDKKIMERLISLSTYYFPMFESELAKKDLPLELKYLPVIESALNPRAKSRVGATGIWQFMYTTGKMEGLDVNSYVDERMDPLKSTEAAVTHLERLYKTFGDWNLALAAYNSGPGNVSKAIRRSGGSRDFWEIRRFLPRETANYVPAFMAVLYVFNHMEDHDFNPYRPEHSYFETDTIHIKHTISFDHISKITGISEELLSFMNPSYKLNVIPYVTGKDYYLRLPVRETGLFVANEKEIYRFVEQKLAEENLPEYQEIPDKIYYRVKSGDYLGKIAGRYGVSVRNIKYWNNLRSNNLRIGQRLVIHPRTPVVAAGNKPAVKPKTTTQNDASGTYYTVKKGDSLWSISRKFKNISISQIREWNGIRGNNLKPGMRLKISES